MRNILRWSSVGLFAALSIFLILFGTLYASVRDMLPFHAAAVPSSALESVRPLYFALMKLIGGSSAALGLLGLYVAVGPVRRGASIAVIALAGAYSSAFLMAAFVAETLARSTNAPTSWNIMGVLLAITAIAAGAHFVIWLQPAESAMATTITWRRERALMTMASRLLVWVGSLFISAIFLDSLRFKFTGHMTPQHIFTTLRDWSGIGLFYPAGPWIIGVGELLAAILLIGGPAIMVLIGKAAWIGSSQFLGALVAFAIMSGAIVFHLFTPLGIVTPVTWAGGEPVSFSPALFYSACVSWVLAILIMILRRDSLWTTLSKGAAAGGG